VSEDYYPTREQLGSFFGKDWRLMQAFEALFRRAGSAGATFVSGDLKVTATTATQSGWLDCDGSIVSRNTYPDLFNAIGETWGAGDGVSTFQLPDYRGRTVIGADGVTYETGDYGGAASVTLSTAQLPAHSHGVTDPGHTHTFTGVAHTHTFTGVAHNHGVTDTGHSHGVTDPTHTHGVTDPGHVHTSLVAANTNTAGAAAGDATAGDTGSATTGVTVNAAATGVTVNSNTTGLTVNNATATGSNDNTTATGSNASSATGITTQNTGSGDAVDILPPFAVARVLIKT
jgi:microcystin-dependent protein